MNADVPLVGRERELRRLVESAGRVRTGGAAVVVIEGEAGIGKSRLAMAALRWAREDGFIGLCGSGGPLQRDLSYAVVVETLRPLVHGPAADVAALVAGLGDLARLFDGLPVTRPAPLGDTGLERTRLFEAVCGLVRRASRRGPLAVLIDDLQWVDSESLALVHYLVRGLADRPVLFVLTSRPGESRREVQELFGALRRSDMLTEITVRPLGQDAVGSLTRALLGGEPPAALLRALTGRTGGVPLFVKELVGALVDSGALARSGDRWVLGAGDLTPMPRVVSDLLRGRIESLPAAVRAVLDMLVVFGGRVTHAVLREVVADDALLLDGIARLRAAHLVDEQVLEGAVVYRVAHPLLGEVAYDLLPAAARHERHAAAARAVLRIAPDDLRGLAFHVRAAGEVLPPAQSFDVLDRAAREAIAANRGDEAVANARAAIAAATRLGRREVLGELTRLLAEAGQLAGRPEEARAAWLAAADLAGDDVRTRARCVANAAVAEWERGHVDAAEAHLALAAETLAGVPPGPEHLIVTEARVRAAGRRGDTAAERRLIIELDRLAAATGSQRDRVSADVHRVAAAFTGGDFRTGLAGVDALVRETDELHDPLMTELATRSVFMLLLNGGDLALARAHAARALDGARAAGVPTLEVVPQLLLGFADLFGGRWDEAMARSFDVLELAQRVGMVRGAAFGLALQAMLLARRGRFDDATSRVAEARTHYGHWPDVDRRIFSFLDQVTVEIILGRDGAPAAVGAAAELVAGRPVLLPVALATLGHAALGANDVVTARRAADRLEALGDEVRYPAALALWLRGRITRDPALLDAAVDRLVTAGMVYDEVVARLDRAELLTARPDHGTELAADLTRCVEVLDRLGARPQADRARQLLRRLGQRPAPRPTRGRPSELSEREEQVARLVAQGLSNVEVAERLFISKRTVTTHLQNIYGRLGLGSRTALTRYVLERLPGNT
ncbi:helix-turn-helix transcriptional regulator [Amycolatopsis sp. cmx-4-68]|uniref:helix-turn-helix transcriptional regulator n=1 Tax=Amycolatopsis sp. cmx-4-68 TaxID=2790938 RepID=UPI00397D3560